MTVINGYDLIELEGMWFLEKDSRIVSTLVNMGGGTWRCRTPAGAVQTIEVPGDVDDPARYVAELIT